MIRYNSNNNAYCRAVNAQTFETIEHNPVWISILLFTRNPYSYPHFEIVICINSVRGDIDQLSTNTSSYTICRAPNVYIFVYILIETRIAPLRCPLKRSLVSFFVHSTLLNITSLQGTWCYIILHFESCHAYAIAFLHFLFVSCIFSDLTLSLSLFLMPFHCERPSRSYSEYKC